MAHILRTAAQLATCRLKVDGLEQEQAELRCSDVGRVCVQVYESVYARER